MTVEENSSEFSIDDDVKVQDLIITDPSFTREAIDWDIVREAASDVILTQNSADEWFYYFVIPMEVIHAFTHKVHEREVSEIPD